MYTERKFIMKFIIQFLFYSLYLVVLYSLCLFEGNLVSFKHIFQVEFCVQLVLFFKIFITFLFFFCNFSRNFFVDCMNNLFPVYQHESKFRKLCPFLCLRHFVFYRIHQALKEAINVLSLIIILKKIFDIDFTSNIVFRKHIR